MADETTGSAWDYSTAVNWQKWAPGTEVLLGRVPWDSQYRNVVKFDNRVKVWEYVKGHTISRVEVGKTTYHAPGMPVRLDVPLNAAERANYIAIRNEFAEHDENVRHSRDTPRNYFYFILSSRYISPHTTEFILMLDVWATYQENVTFGRCFVERGHLGMLPIEKRLSQHSFLTEPEGLDLGPEYYSYFSTSHTLASASGKDWAVLFISATSFTSSPGSQDNPRLESASGSVVEGLPSGADVYVACSAHAFNLFLTAASAYPWVTQGILCAYIIPAWAAKRAAEAHRHKAIATEYSAVFTGNYDEYNVGINGVVKLDGVHDNFRAPRTSDSEYSFNVGSRFAEALPEKLRHMRKFAFAPYHMYQVTNFSGKELNIRPEMLDGEGTVKLKTLAHYSMPNPRIVAYVSNLRQSGPVAFSGGAEIFGTFLDYSLTVSEFPQIPVVNDGYRMFMAQNAHTIAQSNQAADWAYQKAMRGNELSYNQSTSAMDMATRNVGISNRAAMAHMEMQNSFLGGQNAITANAENSLNNIGRGMDAFSALTNLATKNVGGLIGVGAGRVQTELSRNVTNAARNESVALQQSTNRTNAMISAGAATDLNASSMRHAAYVRDSNRQYADFAARGDYEQALAAINAKVQDARITAPSLAGQIGGEAFNLTTVGQRVNVRLLGLSHSVYYKIGRFWARYGYAINRTAIIGPHLTCMSKFTYWKLGEANVLGWLNEEFLLTIRGIFEKGVTIWNSADDIGITDELDNVPAYRVDWTLL